MTAALKQQGYTVRKNHDKLQLLVVEPAADADAKGSGKQRKDGAAEAKAAKTHGAALKAISGVVAAAPSLRMQPHSASEATTTTACPGELTPWLLDNAVQLAATKWR